jgi:hypothetical protein
MPQRFCAEDLSAGWFQGKFSLTLFFFLAKKKGESNVTPFSGDGAHSRVGVSV